MQMTHILIFIIILGYINNTFCYILNLKKQFIYRISVQIVSQLKEQHYRKKEWARMVHYVSLFGILL